MKPIQRESHSTVLIVDDHDDTRDGLSSLLAKQGYQVRSASGAVEALRDLEQGPLPDVILLDLMMPGMSGWDFRVEQRLRPRLAQIPVVAISANDSAQARAISADAYIAKPFEPQDLLDTIARVLVASERTQLKAQLAESERLRALGLLAAGVAHEVNNPLTVVLAGSGLSLTAVNALEEHVAPGGAELLRTLQKQLSDVAASAERIAGVVRGIATLGRPDDSQMVEVDVADALNTAIRLVANEIRHRGRLVRDLRPVPRVRGSASKLVQIFVNILTNAAHAIPEGEADVQEVRVATLEEQGRVVIEIADTGTGMTKEVMARVFDPFFTTKPVGLGTGLGLSITHRLVSELGGEISVTSRVGEGSTFRVVLPAATGPSPSLQPPPAPARASRVRRRVLVIDDEPQMCDLLSFMLSEAYEVNTCTSARQAVELLRQGRQFDAILCDLMMPDLTGMDLHAELTRNFPELAPRVVFMSGGAFTDSASSFGSDPSRELLVKPFLPADVTRRLEELFEHTHRSGRELQLSTASAAARA